MFFFFFEKQAIQGFLAYATIMPHLHPNYAVDIAPMNQTGSDATKMGFYGLLKSRIGLSDDVLHNRLLF